MKLLTSLSIAAATLALSSPVFAQSTSKNVVLNASLVSLCRFVDSTALTIALGEYTAFGGPLSNSGTADIECTRHTVDPTFAFTGGPEGLISGLRFTVTTAYSGGGAGVAPNATFPLGTPRTGQVSVTASIAGGQAGEGISGAITATKVLTVTF